MSFILWFLRSDLYKHTIDKAPVMVSTVTERAGIHIDKGEKNSLPYRPFA